MRENGCSCSSIAIGWWLSSSLVRLTISINSFGRLSSSFGRLSSSSSFGRLTSSIVDSFGRLTSSISR